MLVRLRGHPAIALAFPGRDGGTGIRSRLKICRPQGHEGSIPSPGTKKPLQPASNLLAVSARHPCFSYEDCLTTASLRVKARQLQSGERGVRWGHQNLKLGVRVPLTDIEVRNAKPRDRPYKLADERGMYLLVNPSGGKLGPSTSARSSPSPPESAFDAHHGPDHNRARAFEMAIR
jgi:hypothetical protein